MTDDTTRQAAEQAWLDIEEGEWYGQPPDELWIRGYVAGYAAAEQRAETAERERTKEAERLRDQYNDAASRHWMLYVTEQSKRLALEEQFRTGK